MSPPYPLMILYIVRECDARLFVLFVAGCFDDIDYCSIHIYKNGIFRNQQKGAGVCSVPFYVLCFYISVNGAVSSDLQFSGKPIWTNEMLSEYSSITASSSVTNSFQRLGFGDNNRRICRYWYRRILLLSMFIFCVTYMGYLGMVPNLK